MRRAHTSTRLKKYIGICFTFIVFMINLANLEINYQCLSLSLSWTCQRDRVPLLIKFGLNKNNFALKNDNYEFEFKLDLLERYRFTPC